MLRNISRGGLNSSRCASEGWETVGIPSLMYASEILPWPGSVGKAIDIEQNRMGRFILGMSSGGMHRGNKETIGGGEWNSG